MVHTNSLAGFLGVPLQGPYSAAKGAARLLMDTCRVEFAGWGIKFLSLYPGFVATEKTQDDGMPAPLEISEEPEAGLKGAALLGAAGAGLIDDPVAVACDPGNQGPLHLGKALWRIIVRELRHT